MERGLEALMEGGGVDCKPGNNRPSARPRASERARRGRPSGGDTSVTLWQLFSSCTGLKWSHCSLRIFPAQVFLFFFKPAVRVVYAFSNECRAFVLELVRGFVVTDDTGPCYADRCCRCEGAAATQLRTMRGPCVSLSLSLSLGDYSVIIRRCTV